MKTFISALVLVLSSTAFATPECDWSMTVQKNDPGNIAGAQAQINLRNGLIEKEKETLRKEIEPQLLAWQHALSLYDTNTENTRKAQLAVNDAINYMREAIILDKTVKLTFDRLTKKIDVGSQKPFSVQIREALPKMKLHDSTRVTLEQWANAIALIESSQSRWLTAEEEILKSVRDAKFSLSDTLVERLRQLNSDLETDLEKFKDGRAQDETKEKQLLDAVEQVQKKIASYLDQITTFQKQIEHWQAELNKWTPTSRYCFQSVGRHGVL